ncbi:hypothetical protein [Romboutsia lituseburensis]|uniref:hypothetical protein n=1 Tax=Romboutsia lituseburensis TaxID=1537 RepID=UPI00215AEBDD|nr:hypothetical protein [Romboutsia lituseburensis]MCR8744607.1 hypothetical protein [Romboutsia lituseburensis]
MYSKLKKNDFFCPVLVNRIYDRSKATTKLSSNIPMNFQVFSQCPLPSNTKLEIVKTNFKYEICNIDKKILINGHNINCCKNSIKDTICIDNKMLSTTNDECNKITFNIIENLNVSFKVEIEIEGIAYINDCQKIYFEAIGCGEDNINAIILSNILIPNPRNLSNNAYLEINNDILGLASPDCIFLSPIFDCKKNIDSLFGNVFLNYMIELDISCLMPSALNLLKSKC